jgi:hypothetical protein
MRRAGPLIVAQSDRRTSRFACKRGVLSIGDAGTSVANCAGMTRPLRFGSLTVALGGAVLLSLSACAGEVVPGEPGTGGKGTGGHETASVGTGATGTGAEGTGGVGTGGAGTGGATCTAYTGEGCTPGSTSTCTIPAGGGSTSGGPDSATTTCVLQPEPGQPCATYFDQSPCNTPLVLSFDGAPVEYLTDARHAFDVNGARSQVTDWPSARTPWLAIDRDGNGRIDDGAELFGSMTVLSSGHRAPNGFAALRELDADGDGRITPADPGFAKLLVWADRDGDRVSSATEMATAASWELLSIDLDYTSEPRCDAHGNCEVERASFRWRDARGVVRTGAVVDVHLAAQ